MPKTKMSREKLCRQILAAIQEYPGCKDVKEVSIAEIGDTAAESIWRVTVVDSGGVDIEKANHAARNVQKEIRQQYDLLTRQGCRNHPMQSASGCAQVFP